MKELYQKLLENKYQQEFPWHLRSFFQKSKKQDFINLASLDPLRLVSHPLVHQNACLFAMRYGLGQKSSKGTLSYLKVKNQIEEKLATALGFEAVTLCKGDLAIIDLCHDALLKPLACVGVFESYPIDIYHKHSISLSNTFFSEDTLLAQKEMQSVPKALFVNSLSIKKPVFQDLSILSKQIDALLIAFDSLFGLDGYEGFGTLKEYQNIDVLWGQFYKSYSPLGSFFASSQNIKEYLFANCPELELSSPDPFTLGAIAAYIDLLPTKEKQRKQLKKLHQKTAEMLTNFEHLFKVKQDFPYTLLSFLEKESAFLFHQTLTEEGFLLSSIEERAHESLCKIRLQEIHTPETIRELEKAVQSFEKIIEKSLSTSASYDHLNVN